MDGPHEAISSQTVRGLNKREYVREVLRPADQKTHYHGYGRHYRITDMGRTALADAQVLEPTQSLTKFQREVLVAAREQKSEGDYARPLEVRRYGLRDPSKEQLLAMGVIEWRLRYDTDDTKTALAQKVKKVNQARSAIHDSWESALKYLKQAEDLEKRLTERGLFITEKGLEAIKGKSMKKLEKSE